MRNRKWSFSDKIASAGLLVAVIGTIGTYLALFTPEFRKCVGIESGDCLLRKLKFSKSDASSNLLTEDILNASWKEVPGTYTRSEWNEGFEGKGSAFIDINRISRNGEFMIFDMVDVEGGYGQIEGDCRKQRWRTIRFGSFESNTRVSFVYTDDAWQGDVNQFKQTVLNYVCRESKL